MDIAKIDIKLIQGGGDGPAFALIKNNVAYMFVAENINEAILKAEKKGIGKKNQWKISKNKAVQIPGIWEYEMAEFNAEEK
tara:strand:- start:586 stop:828 length:243 start_codon:yes stop_codon:yes gene_type:complete